MTIVKNKKNDNDLNANLYRDNDVNVDKNEIKKIKFEFFFKRSLFFSHLFFKYIKF